IKKGHKPSKVAIRIALLYLLSLVGSLTGLVLWDGDPVLRAVVPNVLLVAACLVFAFLPEDKFHQSRVHPVIHQRWATGLRITFISLVFNALAWGTWATGYWWAVFYFLLWLVPIGTSFSFFMILRQLVQHGNADRGWLTNTRSFFVGPLIRFSVFPM